VHDNLRNLGLDVLDVVNLRSMFDVHGPAEGGTMRALLFFVCAKLRRKFYFVKEHRNFRQLGSSAAD
jgi:pyridoxine 4-dehydrogenase